MKLALASVEFKNNDVQFNLRQIENYVIEASKNYCDAICFGEAFLQGFDCLNFEYDHDMNIAIDQDSDIMNQIKSFTILYGIDIMLGYIEKENRDIYSSYIILSSGKILYNYRRVSKGWKEYWRTNDYYKEGNNTDCFTYKNMQIKIALCGDLWEDDSIRFKDCELLIWPVYCNYPKEEWENGVLEEYALQAKSIASKVLFINSRSKNPISLGGAYYFYEGKIRSRLDLGNEGLLYVNV